MERLLVTGLDYPLGANLALTLSDRCAVLGVTGQREPLALPSVQTAYCSSGDCSSLDAILDDWRPRWILHCGALSLSAWDSEPTASQTEAELRVATHLGRRACEIGAALTVISSDAVFAGPRMFHDEKMSATGDGILAGKARAMERALSASQALIVRTHAYGWSPRPENAGFAERAYQMLREGTMPAADGRSYATPIAATDLAALLWRGHELRLTGLYHIAGAERASRWSFVRELAASMGLSLPRLSETLSVTDHAPCWEETSLNCQRARRALEMGAPLLREGIAHFVAQSVNGWRDQLRHVSLAHEAAA